ncbi:MAG: NAD-glutamate dehydrogenase domain-containing protein [Sedimenticolaceae bacterium]
MPSMTNDLLVLNRVKDRVRLDQEKLEDNLAWLNTEMHRYFFSFNTDDAEALTLLAINLHRMADFRRLNLVAREDRSMIAQLDEPGSLHRALGALREKNISYGEITTSMAPLPGISEKLEVLRFDYQRKEESEIAQGGGAALPSDIFDSIAGLMPILYPDFNKSELAGILEMLWHNNEEYVRVSPLERVARVIYLYWKTKADDGVHLDVEPLPESDGIEEYRLILGIGNPPHKGFLLQIIEALSRLGVEVMRLYCLTVSDGVYPYLLSTFYVRVLDGHQLTKSSSLYQQLQRELYNIQILSIQSHSYEVFVRGGLSSGTDASLVDAMIGFCHTNLAHNRPDIFDLEGIMRAFQNHPDISLKLVALFHARFDPEILERDVSYADTLEQTLLAVEEYDTGRRFLDGFRRTIFRCAVAFIRHCLKTNFFVAEKHALAFRLDPAYLEDLDEEFTSDLPKDRPFRITFFVGRNGSGYHIGFSDIARGGWRTLITQGRDDYITSANTMFRENYVLAHTQHLKNKDIYEGGSKLVAILNAHPGEGAAFVRQHLYKLQFGFINAFLDLYVTKEGRAADARVVDYYGQDEPIELGPDENMHDEMVELIAVQAVKRGYLLGKGVISSKRIGINHKEYGVTSIGVVRFAEVTMKELGIDMHSQPFSVKFTGGPNGDVAGNAMRLLLERCPQVQIRLIVDGSGALYDPSGLDRAALDKIVLKADVEAYDTAALSPGGYLLYRKETRSEGMRKLYRKVLRTEDGVEESWMSNDDFYRAYNSLLFKVSADLFIPAGGRPETIDAGNFQNFFDDAGNPSARVIVEGANSFITPDARSELQKRGVIIMRDASANKCGVISSSYEILANLMLSDQEFLENKAEYVADVVSILNQLAEQEADLILRRHREAGDTVSYTEISNLVSREINTNYARFFEFFESNPVLCLQPHYENAILHSMPQMIRGSGTYKQRIKNIPVKIKHAIIANTLASSMVYSGDDTAVFSSIIEAQLKRFPNYQ